MHGQEIETMLKLIDVKAEELDDQLPPSYSPNNGWLGVHGSALDLAYRALMIKRQQDDNYEYQQEDSSPTVTPSRKLAKNKSRPEDKSSEIADGNM